MNFSPVGLFLNKVVQIQGTSLAIKFTPPTVQCMLPGESSGGLTMVHVKYLLTVY